MHVYSSLPTHQWDQRIKGDLSHNSRFGFIDDPYYYLYYGKSTRSPSYFTLELQEPEVGRVLRFDSMSKILSAGIRIGFVSGPEAILTAIDRHVRRFFFCFPAIRSDDPVARL